MQLKPSIIHILATDLYFVFHLNESLKKYLIIFTHEKRELIVKCQVKLDKLFKMEKIIQDQFGLSLYDNRNYLSFLK